jgi:signal transduction histidine kinase
VDRLLRLLLLEDIPEESEIVERELRRDGLIFEARRVQTRAEFLTALDEFAPDLVLADSKLPTFDGRSALEIAHRHTPRIPVVMVTGQLGDEAAVDLLIAGASDYILKDRLARLGSAVRRVLQQEEDTRKRERLELALRKATDAERRRLAKELHDGLGQELTALALLAEGLLMQEDRNGQPATPELERLAQVARHATRTCREIAHGMSPLGGTHSLAEALRDLATRLCGPPGPKIVFELDRQAAAFLSREVSEHLYRIAQEALTNAMKHAAATTIQLRVHEQAHGVRLLVIDDGHGSAAPARSSSGIGLSTMRDRAEAIGGTLTIAAPSASAGTVVICDVPSNALSQDLGRHLVAH